LLKANFNNTWHFPKLKLHFVFNSVFCFFSQYPFIEINMNHLYWLWAFL